MGDDYDEDVAVVIDNGTSILKAGLSSDDGPQCVIPNYKGIRHRGHGMGLSFASTKNSYIGSDAQQRRHILKLIYPIENGTIVDFDSMSEIWQHVIENQLKVESDKHPFVITEVPLAPRKNREQITQIFFETFTVPYLYIATQTLALYSTGRTSGLTVSCGDGVCFTTSTYDGTSIVSANQRTKIAGAELTNFLASILTDRGHYFNTSTERDVVREIKEDVAYVSMNFERDIRIADKQPSLFERSYELPDGKLLKVGPERFMCAEPLFRPTLLAQESPSIPKMIFDSVSESGIDTRKTLWENIVVAGGCTMLPNFVPRLKKEIQDLVPATIRPRIFASHDRKNAMWIGGKCLASLSSFQSHCISETKYFEEGVSCSASTK